MLLSKKIITLHPPHAIRQPIHEKVYMKSNPKHKITGKGEKSTHYIDNKEFYAEILKYRKEVENRRALGMDLPRIPEELGNYFLKLCENIASKSCFCGYAHKEDMISMAVENCVKCVPNYGIREGDPKNPFSYFTQVIYWCYVRSIKKEKSTYYNHCKIIEKTILHHDNPKVTDSWSTSTYQPVQDYIKDYESRKKASAESSDEEVPKKAAQR